MPALTLVSPMSLTSINVTKMYSFPVCHPQEASRLSAAEIASVFREISQKAGYSTIARAGGPGVACFPWAKVM